MKNFTRRGNWLDQASWDIRAIYSFFLVFALIGHLSFILMVVKQVGPGYEKVVAHYRGGEGEFEMTFPKEFSELLEVTHFHAYIEGLMLLVLTHLFVVIPISQGLKRGIIGLAFGSTFLELLSPWMIRYITPYAAFGQIAAWIGMCVSYLPLSLLPVYYLWRKNPSTINRQP